MNLSVITILIICAFFLFGVKYLQDSCKNGTLEKRLQSFARNALRITYLGIAAVGVLLLALFFFPVLRFVGFAVIPSGSIQVIRKLLKAVFKFDSVYATLQLLACAALFAAGFSLLFSIFGFVAARVFAIFRFVKGTYVKNTSEAWRNSGGERKRSFGKIFLHFAHLRI